MRSASITHDLVLAFVLVVATAGASRASESYAGLTGYSWVSWTTTQGIFPGPFRAIAQDRQGYLWLGVSGDLVRFDGVRFVDAETLTEQPLSSKGVVTAICAARDGSLWVGRSSGGVSRIQGTQVTNYGVVEGVPAGTVTAVIEDSQGLIWVGTRVGVAAFRKNHWQVEFSGGVNNIFEDHAKNLWIDVAGQIFVRRPDAHGFEQVRSASPSVQSFAEDQAGAIWVTDRALGFRRVATPDTRTVALPLPPGSVIRLLQDHAGNLWVGTRGHGLFRVRGHDNGGPVSVQRLGKADGLTSDVVLSLFEDREGDILVGTENNLLRLSKNDGITIGQVASSSAHEVAATSDGSVWLGTTAGLRRFTGLSSRLYTDKDGLPSNVITALTPNVTGTLWVATDRGLARFANERFWPVRLPGGLVPTNLASMTTDHAGGLWLCDGEQGLFRWHIDGELDSLAQWTDVRKRCPSAYSDRAGHVWVGFSEGIVAVYRDDHFTIYRERDGLTGGIVTAFHEDLDGVMWVGTNKGVSRFHEGKFTSFTQANGLPAKAVSGILSDERGYLWFSTIAGLVRIDRREFDRAEADRSYRIRYSLYDAEDGLKGVPLFLGFPNAARGIDGRLWFVTTAGFVTVDPRAIRDHRPPPPPVVESATVNGRVLSPAPNLRFPPGSSEFRIDYTSLGFAAPSKTRFRYKLDGFEPDWVEAGSRRQAIYPNLPPANYHFRVSAATLGGDWADSPGVWEFSVAPRFYQTSWFALVCLGSTIVLLCFAWRHRMNTVKRQVTLVFEERTRMAREIHDTLLQSLVGVALQFDIIGRKLDASPAVAKEHLVRVRDEVEQYIRETRQSIWDLRSPTLQTRDLAAALQHACANLAADHAVQCEFDLAGTTRRYPLRIEEQLMRIGLEALTNAVRHSGAQKIRLNLTYSASSVALGVTDDGCGFDPVAPPNGNGNHWGLADMRERARQIGARFNLVSEPGGGTTIEAFIPYAARATEEATGRAEQY